jgi:hypothetical protein
MCGIVSALSLLNSPLSLERGLGFVGYLVSHALDGGFDLCELDTRGVVGHLQGLPHVVAPDILHTLKSLHLPLQHWNAGGAVHPGNRDGLHDQI